jgi:hypothetical protein
MMRRTVLFLVITVLAVMVLPSLGIGQTTSSHGGSPSDVFTSTHPGMCANVHADSGSVIPTVVTVTQESHLLVNFTAELFELGIREYGLFSMEVLDDAGDAIAGTDFEWGFGGNWITITSPAMTWTFENLPAGVYTVRSNARIERWDGDRDVVPNGGRAILNDCSMTVLVSPVA